MTRSNKESVQVGLEGQEWRLGRRHEESMARRKAVRARVEKAGRKDSSLCS
jgi:hypothetical protein